MSSAAMLRRLVALAPALALPAGLLVACSGTPVPISTLAASFVTPSTSAPSTSADPLASALDASACGPVIRSLPSPTRLVLDPIGLATSNRLAALPAPGIGPRIILGKRSLPTPQDYIRVAVIANPEERIALMQRDGYRGGERINFQSGSDNYGVNILRFRSKVAADDYLQYHLVDACSLTDQMVPLKGLAGVAFLRTDDLARAVFVAGDTEVDLDICTCVEVKDRVALAARWAGAVARQLQAQNPSNA